MANNIIYPVATLLEIEPHLIEYFAYNRTMLYPEIERTYLATWGFMGKVEDKYMIEVPSTLDELATSEHPFAWQRFAPREQKTIKVVDTLAYMTDNIKGILFEDDGLKKKIEELTNKLPDKNRDSIFYTLWMLAIIYKKHEAFKPILDPELLEETYNMDTYFQQVRPEMLQLYLFLERDKRKRDKSITLSNNQEKITINNAMESWFTNLLDSYLHIYLGVNSIEEAEEELKEVYSSKKGRKADNPAQNLVMVGIYRLLVNHSCMKKKSDIFNFIHDYMVAIGLIISGDIDVNYINAKIAYLEKHGYKPEWIPASQGNYRTSPNNPSKLYFW